MPAPALAYEVAANLRVSGNLANQMARMTRHVPGVAGDVERLERNISKMGRVMQGTTAATLASWSRIGGTIAAVAGGAGLVMATRNGLAFNRVMEDARLQIGTMFQMFDFGSQSAAVMTGQTSQWSYNLKQAKGAMGELYNIAKKTPATFKNVISIYQNAAAGLSTQTEDLSRHMEFMSRAALLGGLSGGDYQVLGAQVGRIIAGSAGAEMNIWKVLQKPILEAGQRMGVFNKSLKIGDLTQRFNELTGDNRLNVMMEAMEKIGPEIAEAHATSMAGITSTTMSAIEQVTSEFTSPLYEGFREWLVHLNREGGILGDASMEQFRMAAHFAGSKLMDAAGAMYSGLERGAIFLRDNWEATMQTTHRTFQAITLAFKLAMVAGATRLGTGLAMRAGGAALRGVQRVPGMVSAVRERARRGRMGMLRGIARMRRGPGLLEGIQGMVAGFSKMSTGIVGGLDNLIANGGKAIPMLSRFALSIGAIGMAILPMVAMASGAILVFGGLAIAIAGLAAYFIGSWGEMSASIQHFLKTGHATIRPLVKAGMILWETLKQLGAALVGNATGGDMMKVAVELATKAINGLVWIVRGFVSLMIPVIDAFAGLFEMVGKPELARGAVELSSRLAGIGANMKDVTDLEVDRRTEELTGKLEGLFGAGGAGGKKPPGVPKTGMTINKLEIQVDMRDTDPDRLMAGLFEPLERIAAQRGQAWDILDEGV